MTLSAELPLSALPLPPAEVWAGQLRGPDLWAHLHDAAGLPLPLSGLCGAGHDVWPGHRLLPAPLPLPPRVTGALTVLLGSRLGSMPVPQLCRQLLLLLLLPYVWCCCLHSCCPTHRKLFASIC